MNNTGQTGHTGKPGADRERKIRILADSREQLPYRFDGAVTSKLDVGDYSIAGAEHLVSIERKSLDDLVGSLSRGRERFERELYRMRALDYGCLVVEASLQDIVQHRYRSEMSPASVVQSLVAFSIRYQLPIWFAGDRACGQRLTESILSKYHRETEKIWAGVNGGSPTP